MSLLKFVFYSLVAYLVIRMVVRIFFTPKRQQQNPFTNSHQNSTQSYSAKENLDKPKFTIEAESVDYEVIEPEEKNEKK